MKEQASSKTFNITLWIAQVLLAAFFVSAAIMKFMPIEKIEAQMEWMGQIPVLVVRLLGIIDLLGALGLILPPWLRIKPLLTPWTAVCIIILMLSAVIFHVSSGEASVIGINIIAAFIAVFIAWGRFIKAPVSSK